MPLVNRAFAWWLSPRPGGPGWVTLCGVALIVGLNGLSVAVFRLRLQLDEVTRKAAQPASVTGSAPRADPDRIRAGARQRAG